MVSARNEKLCLGLGLSAVGAGLSMVYFSVSFGVVLMVVGIAVLAIWYRSFKTAQHLDGSEEPRVDADIKINRSALWTKTEFLLTNTGKEVAYDVQVRTLNVDGKCIVFPNVPSIPIGETMPVTPTLKNSNTVNDHNVFHWMLQDWNRNGELKEEWCVQVEIEYRDPHRKAKPFISVMDLVLFPIKYASVERNGKQSLFANESLYEIRNRKFSHG